MFIIIIIIITINAGFTNMETLFDRNVQSAPWPLAYFLFCE